MLNFFGYLIAIFLLIGSSSFANQGDAVKNQFKKKTFNKASDSVLIIGAGVSGISIATTLLNEGVPADHITIIEKEAEIGGKVNSFEHNGFQYPMGAQLIVPNHYYEVEELIKKHGLETYPLNSEGRGGHLDIREGSESKGELISVLSDEERTKLIEELTLYTILYNGRWNMSNEEYPYAIRHPYGFSSVRPELEQDWYQFINYELPEPIKIGDQTIEKLDFRTMNKALVSLLGGSGYAYKTVDQTQAGRLVRIFTPGLFKELFLNPDAVQVFKDGYQLLWQLEAKELMRAGVEIRLNTKVTNLKRRVNNDPVEVSMEMEAKKAEGSPLSSVESYDHVFFTSSPKNLKWLVKDLRPDILDSFNNIVSSDYRTYLVAAVDKDGSPHPTGIPSPDISGKSLSFGIYPYIFGDANDNDVIGKPVLMAKPHASQNVYTVYIHGDQSVTHDSIVSEIKDVFELSGYMGEIEILNYVNWKYFDREKSGIKMTFDKFMDFQGRGGVWMTGEYSSFAGTHEVYRIAKQYTEMFVKGELGHLEQQ